MNCFLFKEKIKQNYNNYNQPIEDDKLEKWKQTSKLFLIKLEDHLLVKTYDDIFKHYKIFFLTLNPIMNIPNWSSDMKKIVKKYSKDCFSNVFYNFEWKTDNGLRLHSHSLIYIKKTKDNNRYGKKWFLSKSGMMMSILGHKECIDVKQCYKTETHLKYIKYIMGIKQKCKLPYVEEDKRIRKEHFHPPIPDYILNNSNEFLGSYLMARIRELKKTHQINFN